MGKGKKNEILVWKLVMGACGFEVICGLKLEKKNNEKEKERKKQKEYRKKK